MDSRSVYVRQLCEGLAGVALHGFMNSLIIVVIVLTIGMLVSAMSAYAFGKFEFPYKGMLFMGLLGTMMIPYSVVMIPQYIGFSRLDWVDTLAAHHSWPVRQHRCHLFIRQYLQSAMPTELIEAAKIDGCAFRAFSSRSRRS